MNPPPTKRWFIVRRCLIGLAVCLTLIGLFYTEELWRGQRAWEKCKRELEAKGVDFNWADCIPAPVPDNENVFGVPEMMKWFTGRGHTGLSKRLEYPGLATKRTARLLVADFKISLPGADCENGSNVLHWGDPHTQAQAGQLIKDALGPVGRHPSSTNLLFTARSAEEIHPAQIILQCQTAPTAQELRQFLPKLIAWTDGPDPEQIQVEPAEGGSYKVTMAAPENVAEFLQWSEQLEPDFALIRQALQRPSVRMIWDYSEPYKVPIPNFITERIMVQTLSAMAQCHLLQEKPEEALRDLTLMNDICRIDTNPPITLVGAMLDSAVRGVYTATIADGLRWQAWRDPQLAALEKQLHAINVLRPLQQSFTMEQAAACRTLENTPFARLLEMFMDNERGQKTKAWTALEYSIIGGLFPRGWIYQNMVTDANLYNDSIAGVDSASQTVLPDKIEAGGRKHAAISPWSPYTFMAALAFPSTVKAYRTTALKQTQVHQALIACALERYHLAHGVYPESLDALTPQFVAEIPHDVIGGQPPHYRRAADGTFILYSVGWNGRDGGGVGGQSNEEGDWVWPEP